jgi:hypothetical protein
VAPGLRSPLHSAPILRGITSDIRIAAYQGVLAPAIPIGDRQEPRVKPDSDSRQAAEHVKKQEQPQTHKDGEAQKLVDRIEKKVDDQREKSIREDAGQASAARLNLRSFVPTLIFPSG